jgi:hypothetical protein
MYGTGEYCSTDPFFQMRMNVGLDVRFPIRVFINTYCIQIYMGIKEGMHSYTGERKSTRAVPLPARCTEKKRIQK